VSKLKPSITQQADMRHRLRALKDKLEEVEARKNEPIAVVGIGCRFPAGANNREAFWNLLCKSENCVSAISERRLTLAGLVATDLVTLSGNQQGLRWMGSIEDIDCFDSVFFNISPREASLTDPQQRILLETSWQAIEDAGYAPKSTPLNRTGLYIGCSGHDYEKLLELDVGGSDGIAIVGTSAHAIAGRAAYILGIQGPVMAIDTACSSSLVAVHQAVQSLRLHECDLALAGGISLILTQWATLQAAAAGVLSASGKCKAFDSSADGYVRGEGCGIVVLKRLSDALSANDCIDAVIVGSGVNHGGHSGGLTIPNLSAQQELINQVTARAGLSPLDIEYVEAHGSGTQLGDPIEMMAIAKALCLGRLKENPLFVGSVKSNMGHLEASAGIAGLIKAVLCVKNKRIPAHLHFKNGNPEIPWQDLPIRIPSSEISWESSEKRKFACVNSFGLTGTNAHVIVGESQMKNFPNEVSKWNVFPLSAKTSEALFQRIKDLSEYLSRNENTVLDDIAFTLQIGRDHFPWRIAFTTNDKKKLLKFLESKLGKCGGIVRSKLRRTTFLFSGAGEGIFGIARPCFDSFPGFKEAFEECREYMRGIADIDLNKLIIDYDSQTGIGMTINQFETKILPETLYNNSNQYNQTIENHCLSFVLGYSLAKTWMRWGIHPAQVCGYSLGEYVAACISGAMTVSDALSVVIQRAKILQKLPDGLMMAVCLSEERVQNRIGKNTSIAAVNGDEHCVVSGSRTDILSLHERFIKDGIAAKILQTNKPFHSNYVQSVSQELMQLFSNINIHEPNIPYVSCLTGSLVKSGDLINPKYWVEQTMGCVRFQEAAQEILKQKENAILEVGSGQALTSMLSQKMIGTGSIDEPVLTASLSGSANHNEQFHSFYSALEMLWQHGVSVNWGNFSENLAKKRIHLPTYPFARQSHWVDFGIDKTGDYKIRWVEKNLHSLLKTDQRAAEKSCTIVFEPSMRKFQDLIADLGAEICNIIRVRFVGDGFRFSDREFAINPTDSSHYEKLLQELESLYPDTKRIYIVHGWNCFDHETQELGNKLEKCISNHAFGLITFLKAIHRYRGAKEFKLRLITNQGLISQTDQCSGLQSAAGWGMGLSIMHEFPDIWDGMVDTDLENPEVNRAALFGEWIDACEDRIAICNTNVFVPRLSQVSANKKSTMGFRFTKESTYIITGGLGFLGLHIAKWLAEKGVQVIALLSRSGTISSSADRYIRQIEHLGTQVYVMKADITDQGALEKCLIDINSLSSQPIKGIIHAAGIASSKDFLELDRKELERVVRVKMIGSYNLHNALQKYPIEAFVCISSISAVWGAKGLTPYAMGNYFMDNLCNFRKRKKMPALSINLGPIAGGGMTSLRSFAELNSMGINPFPPHEVIKRIEAALLKEDAQSVSVRMQWEKFLEFFEARGKRAFFDYHRPDEKGKSKKAPNNDAADDLKVLQGVQAVQYERSAMTAEYVEPGDELQNLLKQIWIEKLRVVNIGIKDSFFELGGNSLIAMSCVSRINQIFETHITLRDFLKNPTIASLAQLIEKELTLELQTISNSENNQEMPTVESYKA
jgi:acyl transferase domain-containing protein/short-subunit dehydrogenase